MSAGGAKPVPRFLNSSPHSAVRRFGVERRCPSADTAIMRRVRSVIPAVLGVVLGLGQAPAADASEVVRLARLVITGKRLSPERLAPAAVQHAEPMARTAQALVRRQRVQVHAALPMTSGADLQARTDAVPSRSLPTFF